MIHINFEITPEHLFPAIQKLFTLSGGKIHRLQKRWDSAKGTPVFTVKGEYTSRGWTEWTQGFQFGCLRRGGLDFGARCAIAHLMMRLNA